MNCDCALRADMSETLCDTLVTWCVRLCALAYIVGRLRLTMFFIQMHIRVLIQIKSLSRRSHK